MNRNNFTKGLHSPHRINQTGYWDLNFCYVSIFHMSVGKAGGLRTTTGTRPLVTRPEKLFVNLSHASISSFVFITLKGLKKSWLLSPLPPHTLLTLQRCRKMQVFYVQAVPDTSCYRRKFKICNNEVICIHFNKIYIRVYNTVVCHFWISIVKGNENCLFVLKGSEMRACLALGSNRKATVGPKEERFDHCSIW